MTRSPFRRRWLGCALAVALLGAPAFSQEEHPLFPSRIRAEVEEGLVKIFWLDTSHPEVEAYQVYRSLVPFDRETFPRSTLVGTVPKGAQAIVDRPPEAGQYYYLVLAVRQGNPVEFFAPFRNVLFAPVAYTPPTPTGQVINVTAQVSGERVILNFQSTDATANVMIFRTEEFPESRSDLEKGVMIAMLSGTVTTYQDIPPPGVPFYYTVVNAQTYAQAGPGLFSPTNRIPEPVGVRLTEVQVRPQVVGPSPRTTLANPEVELIVPDVSRLLAQRSRPAESSPAAPPPTTPQAQPAAPALSLAELGYRERVLRALPLPRLAIEEDVISGRPMGWYAERLPPPVSVSPRLAALLDTLSKQRSEPELPAPVILPEETVSSTHAAARLATLVNRLWPERAWREAISSLTDFLSLETDPKIKQRAYFYRAQAHLFSDQRERAALDFIMAAPSYRPSVEPFLVYLLRPPAP